ncbi:MAG: competence/damage-inducible protein A [Methylobacterium sp.]|jgi:molybdenum cofactor synthesis domain-containing protein|uniref:competence/damage-inducible protein A n=1 Tax=Rhabdaerophilum sp. TaxID=2717341 RepID=UPI0022C3952D|nr:competence/damage-inducible protein A [Methylobacterium sp.]MCZ8271302.1 molybdopterin-binding protein [Beijerinckiaceae bacterium]MCA3654260.1 competence/damage-inducible protein A [Methylobacterium sp.]MCA3659452.1 competence/damage-inducible protein A [Methylobacterium sp.]MCA3659836.1 competence/damage-inducible protein A [Methylobacterium sp.]
MSQVTAAILVIGDEILSGRTKDKNIGYIAEYLTNSGIDLREVRVVPDVEEEIVGAINALRLRYTYLFTTGGIGPTHDDITADCVARAFGVSIAVDERAVNVMLDRYKREELNEARLRMARIPAGAELIDNPISKAPGFMIGNVIVMAGVPNIMQAMLDDVAPRLRTGSRVLARTVDAAGLGEGIYAGGLAAIAVAHPAVSIGSYPAFQAGGFRNQIVLRSRDEAALEAAEKAVIGFIAGLSSDRAPV